MVGGSDPVSAWGKVKDTASKVKDTASKAGKKGLEAGAKLANNALFEGKILSSGKSYTFDSSTEKGIKYAVKPTKGVGYDDNIPGDMRSGQMRSLSGNGATNDIQYAFITLMSNEYEDTPAIMTDDGKIYLKRTPEPGQEGFRVATILFADGKIHDDKGTFVDSGLKLPAEKVSALKANVDDVKAKKALAEKPPVVENKPNITAKKGEPKASGDSTTVQGAKNILEDSTKRANETLNY